MISKSEHAAISPVVRPAAGSRHELMIRAATHGGFVVFDGARPGEYRDVLFAGSLTETLRFVESTLNPGEPS